MLTTWDLLLGASGGFVMAWAFFRLAFWRNFALGLTASAVATAIALDGPEGYRNWLRYAVQGALQHEAFSLSLAAGVLLGVGWALAVADSRKS